MVDKNEISGGAKELGGKIKEGVGKLVGNERLQAEGAVDQLAVVVLRKEAESLQRRLGG